MRGIGEVTVKSVRRGGPLARAPFHLLTCALCGHPLATPTQHRDRVKDGGHAPLAYRDRGAAYARAGGVSRV